MTRIRMLARCSLVATALVAVVACSSSSKSSSSSSTSSTASGSSSASSSGSSSGASGASASSGETTTTAASKLSESISPDTGLKDGDTVTITGKGFTAGSKYGFTECADKGNATGAGDCDLRTIKVATADSSGTVTSPFVVAKGPFGSNNIVCSASQPCEVSIANAGSANPTEVTTEHITFAS